MTVKPKKALGQHFLKNPEICARIAEAITLHGDYKTVLEIGPGMGALTQYLLARPEFETHVVEIDRESVDYLNVHFGALRGRIHEADFLRMPLEKLFAEPFAVVGNFPYNISSQIVFKVLDHMDQVPELVGMFQREVAQRFASGPGNKDYGIISVLAQAYYDIEYLFTVNEDEFIPPPKVKSGVIRMRRKFGVELGCDERLFKQVVKTAFNQRRKTLRNSLKSLTQGKVDTSSSLWDKRPEQLGVQEFVALTTIVHAGIRA
ncbi:MAG: 16S rRNA (adenine(1518)-N(6)/adenine(1519)-N(6))-dimethyltransferase RsmA [Flavobacteriales bacterium]|jgi:16S rRNA (adenine1518-N6/adenine1519-N6)-dimethyltransferase